MNAQKQAKPSANHAEKLKQTKDLIQKAAKEHSGKIAQASSLSAEDTIITHIIESQNLPIDIFILNTGKLHPETLEQLEKLKTSKNPVSKLEIHTPDQTKIQKYNQENGEDAIYKNIEMRKKCCQIRKIEPLEKALKGRTAWITGLRKEQSSGRAQITLEDSSEQKTKNLTKYNPLAEWSWGDIWHYIAQNKLPYNPLHDKFYPSIGCAPCTRPITLGEDMRAGRWWWESENTNQDPNSSHIHKECGLHVKNT